MAAQDGYDTGVDLIVLQQLAVSFGLGLLLGLQRERSESSIGGIRTFPLIALFGTVCALLGKTFGGWVVAAGLLALVAIVVYSNFAKIKSGDDSFAVPARMFDPGGGV